MSSISFPLISSSSVSTAKNCFIACDGAPADHFATFVKNLSKNSVSADIFALGQAVGKFKERKIIVKKTYCLDFLSRNMQDTLAGKIAKACFAYAKVITDVGHPFAIKIQRALAEHAPNVIRIAYYDNPEPEVSGGYSTTAAQVMQLAHQVWFANSNLADAQITQDNKQIDLSAQKLIGIGYYPFDKAINIAKRRTAEYDNLRKQLFLDSKIEDKRQKICFYFGGNNEVYYNKAFPAFLDILTEMMKDDRYDLTKYVLIIQRDPGAKDSSPDKVALLAWIEKYGHSEKAPKVILSPYNSDDALVLADKVFYYQTSMNPQFVLSGISTIQIGHDTYNDLLEKNSFVPSVTCADQLKQLLDAENRLSSHIEEKTAEKIVDQRLLLPLLGYQSNWLQNLKSAIGDN